MVWLLMFKINFTLQIIQIKGLNVYESDFEEKHIWISTRTPWSIIRHDFSFLSYTQGGHSSFTLTRVWRSWGNPNVYISIGIVYLPVNPRTHSCSLKNIFKSGLIKLIYVLHMRSFDFQHGRYCKQSPRSPKNSIYL